jgi:uncharacterized protein
MTATAKLLRLHQVDRQIRGLQSRVDRAERFLKLREKKLTELDVKRDSLQTQCRQLQATAHNDEAEVQGIEERINTLREKLNAATTNKQYTALLTEVNTFKADKDAIEERAIETLTRFDEVKTQLEELEITRVELVKLRDLEEAERDAKALEVKDQLDELELKRIEAAAEIPTEVLADYDAEREFREDDVMAPIQEMNRRAVEYCCGACQVLLPMELISSSLSGRALNKCSNCGAYLYFDEATRDIVVPAKR